MLPLVCPFWSYDVLRKNGTREVGVGCYTKKECYRLEIKFRNARQFGR